MKHLLVKYFAIFFALILFCNVAYAAELNQSSVDELEQNGITYYKSGQYEDALDCFFKIPSEQRSEDIYMLVANCFETTGQKYRAIDTLKRLIEINPKNYKAYYNLGNIYLKDEEYSKAIELYNATVFVNNTFEPAYYNAGISFFKLNNFKSALPYFQKVLRLNPQDANSCYNIALVYAKLNKQKQSNKYFGLYENILQKSIVQN
jgi:tetratricopeptide (TPR) repeat protein